jgi:hypothetical protein
MWLFQKPDENRENCTVVSKVKHLIDRGNRKFKNLFIYFSL